MESVLEQSQVLKITKNNNSFIFDREWSKARGLKRIKVVVVVLGQNVKYDISGTQKEVNKYDIFGSYTEVNKYDTSSIKNNWMQISMTFYGSK